MGDDRETRLAGFDERRQALRSGEQRRDVRALGHQMREQTRATIRGDGVGAIRRCTFSTGDFVEPITVWEPGRRLAFAVRSQPAPMRELSPWADVEPPHLDGFLRSERGEFQLVPLAGGRTLLRGTSWYRNRMWPQTYWGFWADELMHRIHGRVLRHVQATSEAEV